MSWMPQSWSNACWLKQEAGQNSQWWNSRLSWFPPILQWMLTVIRKEERVLQRKVGGNQSCNRIPASKPLFRRTFLTLIPLFARVVQAKKGSCPLSPLHETCLTQAYLTRSLSREMIHSMAQSTEMSCAITHLMLYCLKSKLENLESHKDPEGQPNSLLELWI